MQEACLCSRKRRILCEKGPIDGEELGEVLETAFALRDVETLEQGVSLLLSIASQLDIENMREFHLSEVLFESVKMFPAMEGDIIAAMCAMSGKYGWFVTDLVSRTGFVSYAFECLSRGVFEDQILCVLVNGASECQAVRDSIMERFTVVVLANELRNEKRRHLHERISLLLVNLCQFKFHSENQTKLVIRTLCTIIRKNVFLHANILWALHYALVHTQVIDAAWIPRGFLNLEFVANQVVLRLLLVIDLANLECFGPLASIDVSTIYSLLTSTSDDIVKSALACIHALARVSESFQIDFYSLASIVEEAPFLAKREIAKIILDSSLSKEVLCQPSFQFCLIHVLNLYEPDLTPQLVTLALDMLRSGVPLEGIDLDDDALSAIVSPELIAQIHEFLPN